MQIAENKKIKLENRATKMKKKNDTEQIIEKAMKNYNKKEPKKAAAATGPATITTPNKPAK
jgi:hypothetical protein